MAAHGLARDQAGSQWCDALPARTNPRGWPDAEPLAVRRPGSRRILALGDSMTFGAKVDYGQRFTEDLEDERTEVLDPGVSAYGTNQQLRAELARRGW
ncbi:MAG: hypothetical protein ACE37K_05865 [Planctomycetota bacterium]